VAPDWKTFSAKLLTSSEGIHMILAPCDAGWWVDSNGTILGFQVKTSMGDFVLAGHRGSSELTVTNKTSGSVVARVKEGKSIVFSDGASFRIEQKGGVPLLGKRRNEFSSAAGPQFRVDGKNHIWLTDSTDRAHVLLLIAADRFLQEMAHS
jgi:hypothetical protein